MKRLRRFGSRILDNIGVATVFFIMSLFQTILVSWFLSYDPGSPLRNSPSMNLPSWYSITAFFGVMGLLFESEVPLLFSKTFPEDGWKEIVEQQVSSHVETIFKDAQATDEAANFIIDRLDGNKNTKTAQSSHA